MGQLVQKMEVQMVVKIDQIQSVYSGRNGRCCCGCSGKHTYASATREIASKHRGYAVTDDEISDRVVKLICNKINATDAVIEKPTYYYAVVGERVYIAYKREA
jgi:hypothetical protein